MANLQAIKTKYGIVGECEALSRALDVAMQVALTDLSVLIVGESGVGKEVIPRIIHDHSKRKSKKYFAVNCGSIPEGTIDSELFGHEKGAFTGAVGERDGYFGAADGGTLFLDEVGELPLSTQARLLRVLESGEYIRVGSSEIRKTNVRIVAATNVNMQQAITMGRFRRDLYYRLSTIPITMPPLRQRGEDVLKLFKKFAIETAEKYQMQEPVRLSAEAADCFKRYAWPGNIRQLKNVTEQLSVLMRDDRTVTQQTLETMTPELLQTTTSNSIVAPDREQHSTHNYEVEREIIFKMLLELHSDVEELKENIGLKKSRKKLALKSEVYDEYEETK